MLSEAETKQNYSGLKFTTLTRGLVVLLNILTSDVPM